MFRKKNKTFLNKYSKFERQKFPFIYLFIAFPVIQFLIFWVYVNASSIATSFIDGNGNFTWNNFEQVWKALVDVDGYGFNLWDSLKRTWIIWGIGFFILFPIGVLTTYILAKRIPGHYVFRICYIIPGMMGAVMWTSLIQYLVQYDGPITVLLKNMGVELPLLAQKNGLFGAAETAFLTIICVQIVMGLVGNNAVLTGAFTRVPEEIFESAEIDGVGFWRGFFKIAVPCVWPTIATLLTFSLCSVMTADYNIFLYSNGTGQPGMSTVGFLLYNITYQISLRGGSLSSYGYPAALGLFLTIITLPVVLLGKKGIDSIYKGVEI